MNALERSKVTVSLVFLAVLGWALEGCTMMRDFGWDSESPMSETSQTGPAEESLYYTGSADLPLYESPGRDAIARLPLHTKLYRTDLQRGYAHVRIDATGQTGWVENAKLIWRLPKKSSRPESTDPEGRPVLASPAPEPVKTSDPATPNPAPRSSAPSEPSVAPSVFDPY